MVINPVKLFGNFYADPNISNYRLLLHGEACFLALKGTLPDIAAPMSLPLSNYRDLLGGSVTARAVLKGRTAHVDDYIDAFLDTVRQAENMLGARKIRKGDPVYLEFFPRGLETYNDIDRGNAHALMQLAATASRTHAELLGSDLAGELGAFPEGWLRVRGQQQGSAGEVEGKSAEIKAARKLLEVALCTVIHQVAAQYPADVESCSRYFDFSLLYADSRKKKEESEAA